MSSIFVVDKINKYRLYGSKVSEIYYKKVDNFNFPRNILKTKHYYKKTKRRLAIKIIFEFTLF